MKDPLLWIAEGAMMRDILDAAQSDGLMLEDTDERSLLGLFPHLRERLESLLALARLLNETFTLVRPADRFRRTLHAGLVTAARQQAEKQPRPWYAWRAHGKELVIGAAAVGSAVSLAGVAALLIRAHQRGAESEAA